MKQKSFKPIIAAAVILVVCGLIVLYYVSPDWLARSAISIERCKAGLKKRSLTVDNTHFVYLTGGSGPDMVLLHGFGGNKDNFTRMGNYLSDNYRIIIPDLPGFGESTRDSAWDYSIPSQVTRLHKFIKALDIESFHLAGNSMGGGIAAAYAVRHPQRVKSVLLLAPGHVSSAPPSELFQMLEKGKNPFLVKNLKDYKKLLDMLFFEIPFIPRPISIYFAEKMIEDREFLQQAIVDVRTDFYAVEKHILKYPGPVMVVWGAQDRVLHPKGAEILANKASRIKKGIIDDCGHLPMIEKPKQTARIYKEFLRQGDS